jgi:type IV secretion system pilin
MSNIKMPFIFSRSRFFGGATPVRLMAVGILAIIGLAVGPFYASVSASPLTTFAATEVDCPSGQTHPERYDGEEDLQSCCPGSNPTARSCIFSKYINPVVNLLAALVGVAVVASIVAGGIQYSSAAGDPSKVAAAKQRILNSLMALAGFMFLYAFFQWLVPGGVFNGS